MGLFCFTWIACAALFVWSAFTPAPYGDLTRVGGLSEELFGWRAPQPTVPAAQLVSSPVSQADVLVVGDSFSLAPGPHRDHGLLWQSRLVAAGYRVATVHWDRAHPLCADFDGWIASLGFRGRWVMFESVEREVENRLTSTKQCEGPPHPGPEAFATQPPAATPPLPRPNWHEKLLTGLVTQWHSHQARQATGPMSFRDPSAADVARLHAVPDGCQRFSHVLCDRALFLSDDEARPRLQPPHLDLMSDRSRSRRPWRLVWLIVPNKSTYYLDRATVKHTFESLPVRGLGPDVLSALAAAESSDRDIYFPNDSHLSTRGFLVMGDAVVRWLRADPSAR